MICKWTHAASERGVELVVLSIRQRTSVGLRRRINGDFKRRVKVRYYNIMNGIGAGIVAVRHHHCIITCRQIVEYSDIVFLMAIEGIFYIEEIWCGATGYGDGKRARLRTSAHDRCRGACRSRVDRVTLHLHRHCTAHTLFGIDYLHAVGT